MMLLHRRFILRELLQTKKQALIFILCVALSLTSLVAINSFKDTVHRSILADARTLYGGDIIIHSHYPFSPDLLKAVTEQEQQRAVTGAKTHEFYSLVRTATGTEASLLAHIKAVSPGYPLYGRVALKSGRPFRKVFGPGRMVVEQELLDRLHLRVGDRLHLGSAILRIVDVVTHEPDRPLNLFALGPRAFVDEADLGPMDLIKKGSRVEYLLLLKVADQQGIDRITKEINAHALPVQERVDTFKTANSGVKRFFDNLLFFLSLISIFTLLLAGIGMQSSLAALLRERQRTIAIAKALGAGNGFLLSHYLIMVCILGLIGSGLGILTGLMLQHLFPLLFSGLIPANGVIANSIGEIGEGLLLGLAVVLLFTFLPLSAIGHVKPVAVFRHDAATQKKRASFYLALGAGLLLMTGLIIRQLEDVRTGLYFMLGVSLLILLIALMTKVTLSLWARVPLARLSLRQAVKSLFRPGNATRSIIITLGSALSVLLSIYLVEDNLHATFVASYPADAPNLFCLDIQPDQEQAFREIVHGPVQLYPIVRARLTGINGEAIDRQKELNKRRDNLSREFNLTYRDTLLDDEVLVTGRALFRKGWPDNGPTQVSILDTVAEMGDMRINDLLRFNIQGVPLEAQVTSIRTRTRSRLYPFFYFVFPDQVLAKAPKTFFAALKVEPKAIPQLENRIVAGLPNISVINMAATAADLGALLMKLAAIINFFALFSILAGALIIVSAVFATRAARIREAVYYKILGSSTSFVTFVFLYENMLLGLISSVFAVILAQAGSWALCHYLLDIPYHPGWLGSVALIMVTTLLVIGVGLVSSIPIIRQKPSDFLKDQADG